MAIVSGGWEVVVERTLENIGETVRQIATLERVAVWNADHGSDEDVFISAASLCRLTGSLADQMLMHGLKAAETSAHRAVLAPSFRDGRLYSALVTELNRQPRSSNSVTARSRTAPNRGVNRTVDLSKSPADRSADRIHHRLCPLGGGETRWYACAIHDPVIIFQAGSGYLDAIANSCPRCARLSRSYLGCACDHVGSQISRERRVGRKVELIEEAESLVEVIGDEEDGDDDSDA